MMRTLAVIAIVAVTWPASAQERPCQQAQDTPDFARCWHEQMQKSDADVLQKLRALIERHHKHEIANETLNA